MDFGERNQSSMVEPFAATGKNLAAQAGSVQVRTDSGGRGEKAIRLWSKPRQSLLWRRLRTTATLLRTFPKCPQTIPSEKGRL